MKLVQMAPTAQTVIHQVLGVKPGEHVCILTDTDRPSTITQVLGVMAKAAGAETVIVTMTPRLVGGQEPPKVAAAAVLASDVVICQASYAIVHTNTARDALKRGARICEMWGFDEDMMIRGGAIGDYAEVQRVSQALAELLTRGKEARLLTEAGTDLRVSLEGRQGHVLAGVANTPGSFCGFPDGEAAAAPKEGSAEGVLVNPFSIEKAEIAFPKGEVRITVEKGRVVKVEGGTEATFLTRLIEELGESARNLGEFAMGTNPACRLGVTLRETKKCWGTAHVAIGDNKSLGGVVDSPIHMDMIFRDATVIIDGQMVVAKGKVVV